MIDPRGRKKRFIRLPKYPGGKRAFQEFIQKNLVYPAEALQNRIEGTVYVEYQVDGLGNVLDAEVIHGIGYGCDEEAVRVIRLMKFEKAKNRGLRVIATMRTKIHFRLPTALPSQGIQLEYQVTPSSPVQENPVPPSKPSGGYEYTIEW